MPSGPGSGTLLQETSLEWQTLYIHQGQKHILPRGNRGYSEYVEKPESYYPSRIDRVYIIGTWLVNSFKQVLFFVIAGWGRVCAHKKVLWSEELLNHL